MKTSRFAYAMAMGLFLQGALLANAGAEDMQANKMQNTPMKDAQLTHARMHDDQMQAPPIQEDRIMNDRSMNEKMAAPMPAVMLKGSDGHHAAGKVTFTKEMGKDLLVLSDIKVDKVPDGHVYLAKNGDRTQGIDLGILHQFKGRVSFALPAMADPADYDSVIIYCKQYHVEIGRAHLGGKM